MISRTTLLFGLTCALLSLPAHAVTTTETDSAGPTTDPTTGEPVSTIVIVAPADGAHIMGEAPVSVTIMTEAMSDTIGKIDVIVDGTIVKTCEAVATCDVSVDLADGDHGIDATLYDPAMLPLANAAPVTIHVHSSAAATDTDGGTGATDTATGGSTDTTSTSGGTGDSGTSGDGDDDKGGCACSATGSGDVGGAGLLGLVVALPFLRRRRG